MGVVELVLVVRRGTPTGSVGWVLVSTALMGMTLLTLRLMLRLLWRLLLAVEIHLVERGRNRIKCFLMMMTTLYLL